MQGSMLGADSVAAEEKGFPRQKDYDLGESRRCHSCFLDREGHGTERGAEDWDTAVIRGRTAGVRIVVGWRTQRTQRTRQWYRLGTL